MIETPSEILARYADPDAVTSFIAYRRKHKRAALSERGAVMIAKTLQEIAAAGGDATEALDMAQEHGWQTIKVNWYWKQKDGERTNNPRGNSASDTTAREIAFAARANRAPSSDCF